jgi:hypothetical protein
MARPGDEVGVAIQQTIKNMQFPLMLGLILFPIILGSVFKWNFLEWM